MISGKTCNLSRLVRIALFLSVAASLAFTGKASAATTYSGTVYSSSVGATVASGVTVTIQDAGGDINLVTDSNGAFSTTLGTPSAGYRAKIGSYQMSSTVTDGNCGSCHGFSTNFIYGGTQTSSYTVSATAGTGGAVTPTSQSVTSGSTAAFTVMANTGYTTDAAVTGTCATGSWSWTTYTTGAVTGVCSVSFSFRAVTPPTATTGTATNITQTGVTLNATVNPNNFSTTVTFKYGLTTAYGSSVSGGTITGATDQLASATLTGLTCGTTYYFKVKATNSDGTTKGSDATFTTSACTPPTATTDSATNITTTGATLNATVNPNNFSTTVKFQYGLTTAYGSSVSGGTITGATDQPASAAVTGLTCGTTYYFKVKATNSDGVTKGADATFTTSACTPPTATTATATNITDTGATLNGTVNPNNLSTTVTFKYGLTTAYGSSVSGGTITGATDQAVSADVTGLTCGTTYHFKMLATNSDGTTKGSDVKFTTSACTPPTATTGTATNITQTGATLDATVNPSNLSTTVAFKYGLTTAYGSSVSGGPITGATDQAVSADVTGLTCGTTYHFKVKATNTDGTTQGADATFATSACTPPTATTGTATNITTTGATLDATVNPNNLSTTVAFKYGLTTAYGSSISGGTITGATDQPASAAVTGLTCGTKYHFKVKATNYDGTTQGADVKFTTSACTPPTATTGTATNITMTGATLDAMVNPNNLSTTVKFQYGLTTAYGSTTTSVILTGSTDQSASATLTGLTCGTTYHFKVKATNYDGTTQGADATFATLACADLNTAAPPASDFDGDGKSDILFRDVSTGQTAVWMMNGSAVTSNTATSLTQDISWSVQGVGDFDGDKKYDLLWRNVSSGELVVWTMNGSTVASSSAASVNPGAYTSTTGWQVQGIADFNGDGKSDILWRKAETGETAVWFMNGAVKSGGGRTSSSAGAYTSTTGWQVHGVGDFNGDGKADILWRNAETGKTYVWFMDGATVTSSGSTTIQAGAYSSTTGWQIQGIGDFNGDRKADILLRDAVTGRMAIWMMDGKTVTANAYTSIDAGLYTSSTGLQVDAISDYDGDGKSDILLRDAGTGQTRVWVMNGSQVTSDVTTDVNPGSYTSLTGWSVISEETIR